MNAQSLLRRLACTAVLVLGCSSSTQNVAPTPPPPPPPAADDAGATAMSADAAATPAAADAAVVAVADAAPAAPPMAPLPAMPANLHGPTTPWARMNAAQRGHYMDTAVMPVMTAMFHEYDPTHYEHVTCATCHGANARAVHFHMPNTLYALPAFGSPAANELHARQPRMIQFMAERVVPAMAQLLGQQPFNMETHQGFGCAGCHPHAS